MGKCEEHTASSFGDYECAECAYELVLGQRDELKAILEADRRDAGEAREILVDVLESDDFQAQFSSRQHMTGPALRGSIQRALHAVGKVAARERGE